MDESILHIKFRVRLSKAWPCRFLWTYHKTSTSLPLCHTKRETCLTENKLSYVCSWLTMTDSDSIFRRTVLGYYVEGMHAIFDLNTANYGAPAKASPFHALIVLGKRLSILDSCMANLSKFHVVFSSSTFIRLNLCQTVNNFVKHNKSSLLSPLR